MTNQELRAELVHCTAEAFRIYHDIDPADDLLGRKQYELASRLKRLLLEIESAEEVIET